jgi:tetratricopeptide (TPR) repeat protein
MPQYIIADRRDLLGGRIVCLLNAMNLARATGAKLLLTWPLPEVEYRDLVGDPAEIFAGETALRYDPQSGRGSLIAPDAALVAAADRGVEAVAIPEADTIDEYHALVKPQFGEAAAYAVDLRCSIYATDRDAPDFRREQQSLAACFADLAKPAILADAMAALGEALPADAKFAGLHARRLHLLADSLVQINRFNSYAPDALCQELLGSLTGFDAVLVTSDSDAFIDRMRATCPERLLTLNDLGRDFSRLTPAQRAILDIWFLSRAREIYGPFSAFGFAASIVGGGEFRNILVHAARQGMKAAGSRTVAFHAARIEGRLPALAPAARPHPDAAALFWRLAVHLLTEWPFNLQVDAACQTQVAATALALRFIGFADPVALEWHHFVDLCRDAAAGLGEDGQSLLGATLILRHLLEGGEVGEDALMAASDAGAAALCLRVAILAATADAHAARGRAEAAISAYDQAIRLSVSIGLAPRGLYLRKAATHRSAGNLVGELVALRDAEDADPGFPATHHRLGDVLARAGSHIAADRAFARAIELEPDNGAHWYARFALARSRGNRDRALEHLRAAVRCEPANRLWAAGLQAMLGEA